MLLMQLGEVVFGGVGCGLYGMLGFAILNCICSRFDGKERRNASQKQIKAL